MIKVSHFFTLYNTIIQIFVCFPQGFAHLVDVSVHNVKCSQFNESVTMDLCTALVLQGLNNDFMQCCR